MNANAILKNKPLWLARLATWTETGRQSAGHGLQTAGQLAAEVGRRMWPARAEAAGAVKKVVHFIAAPGGGGAEAMLGNLVTAMAGGLWRTEVIVMDGRGWPEAVTRLEAAGAVVHDLEAQAFLRPRTLLRLVKLLRTLKPDVVQTWMHHADFVGGWCARLAGVRHVVWGIHCREVHRNPGDGDVKMGLTRWLLGGSAWVVPTRIVSCSEVAMKDHLRMGYPGDAMMWVPNGIDTGRFVPDRTARREVRKELRVPEAAPLVGFVGRFHEMKNLATWLRAAALLQALRPETHFWLCGGQEWDLDDCARAALSVMPHRNQVHFTGFRPDAQRVYPALDVFSLSSRTEACPMTVMEAMSCGVPCVTTDVGDCGRLLEGVGQVVPVRDAEALARAWGEALEKPAANAARLRKSAVERFDIQVAARMYEGVYREVLAI